MTDSALARPAGGAPSGGERRVVVPLPRVRWGTRLLLPGGILLATAVLFAVTAGDAWRAARRVQVAAVLVRPVEANGRSGDTVVQAAGWVAPDPYPTAVSALTEGVVQEVLVLEGDVLVPGQVVARLVDADAQLALAQADAEVQRHAAMLEAARADLHAGQQNWDHPVELDRRLVTARAELAQVDAELARWPAELAGATARAAYLQAEYERIGPLRELAQASEIELIQARQAHETQQANVAWIRGRAAVLAAQQAGLAAELKAAEETRRLRIADEQSLATARAAVSRAEGELALATARQAEARLRLERTRVCAPVGGVVQARRVHPGSKLRLDGDDPESAIVVRVYDPARLHVRVDVPLADAARVQVGQAVDVSVEALPGRTFGGRVTRIVPEADVQKNTLPVIVLIESPAAEIKPAMLARARFLSAPASGEAAAGVQLLVPDASVFERGGQPAVCVADQVERVARFVAVTVAPGAPAGWVAIANGLNPGDRVVIEAPHALRDGEPIVLVEE